MLAPCVGKSNSGKTLNLEGRKGTRRVISRKKSFVNQRPGSFLFLLSGRCCRRLRRRGLRLDGLRLELIEYGTRAPTPCGVHRQRNGGDHEGDRRPRGRPRKSAGRAARTERRLAALPAESRGNVPALAALQQHDDDNEETDQNVDRND